MMNRECAPVKAEPLPGTVKLYHRHLFVCTGLVDWAERIETGGGFLQTLAEAIARRAAEMPLQVKLTACDDPGSQSGFDLLVFPDNVATEACARQTFLFSLRSIWFVIRCLTR